MPLYYVYILKCENIKNGNVSLYTGSTQDLMKRFEQHRKGVGGAKYTRGKKLELVYFETHLTRSDVMKREYEIKSYTSSKKWEIVDEFQKKMEDSKSK
ncbi:GIY-YIG nuclease family protein [Promethearchaeum syntrophicum]|uniref:GIY-YIG nuclease family protein n=1 Tax=Promethearchaeum syntrophicum TaxID=2594042 RepID=A0A5B9DBP9_9ARCH|nr:GIY-YIG nuclease family protein [Candidatus Prometheoarchaeum syntrophicum]QEE16689.1 GIY-YIG nuclease superfamily protein [Candidatus Prometheoarchaeum syntrophicum]